MKGITRFNLLLVNGVLCLFLLCGQVSASSVSIIEPQNPGFWQGGKVSGTSSQPSVSNDGLKGASKVQLDQYYQEMVQRLRLEEKRTLVDVKKHWPIAELSGKSKWVEYGDGWQSKRVVDFASNEIRVSSLSRMSNRESKEFAGIQLGELLSSTIFAALQRDPVLKHVLNIEDQEGLDQLVFSELFKTEAPTAKDISKLTHRLMKRAYARYRDQLAVRGNGGLQGASSKVTYVIPLPKSRMRDKAKQYLSSVRRYSSEFDIPADLVMAIMHTESHFNPLARSHIPAFGLMQIVPRTAGRDASRVLFNKKKLLSAGFLYQPDNNIKVGAAYLNILSFRYLKNIKNPVSRMYCMVAAYNAGSTNVARAFIPVPQMQKAVGVINEMSNQQVLMRLIKFLPQRETREYVEKVLKRRKLYSRV
ncbi:MAG: transglycosylase SLT domain-containing protein [Pseudomonadales bacterium]|nr:transglycosylase SLT domain-containing protein [Pseudomonadales bacterium]